MAVVESISNDLLPVMYQMHRELAKKARQYHNIVKVGRTHLQDALPVTLGQEFAGYDTMVKKGIRRIKNALPNLLELPLGGTAVGTGLNAHPELAQRVIGKINELTGFSFREAEDHFEAQGARDAIVEASATLKMVSTSVLKIANDIRWMGSGPYGGIGELFLPSVQPGSSMMPGKSNPVIPEAMIQVCVQVAGNDMAVSIAGHMGHFELNSMIPLMGNNILQSIAYLANGLRIFTEMCIKGIRANQRRSADLLEKNLAMVTALAPVLGYEYASDLASEAFRTRRSLKAVLLKRKVLPESKIDSILNPLRLTGAGKETKED
jgi:fumarate hydratase class II